jgi:hypothetical protein
MVITNARHACGPDLPVACSVRGTVNEYGFAWDYPGHHGHCKPIEWSAL